MIVVKQPASALCLVETISTLKLPQYFQKGQIRLRRSPTAAITQGKRNGAASKHRCGVGQRNQLSGTAERYAHRQAAKSEWPHRRGAERARRHHHRPARVLCLQCHHALSAGTGDDPESKRKIGEIPLIGGQCYDLRAEGSGQHAGRDLVRETAKLFGFQRTGTAIQARISEDIDHLVQENRIRQDSGMLVYMEL